MKIHIIGASGSGKSYFARTLSEKIHTPSYSLDDLFWDNSSSSYCVKRDAAVRDAMLEEILKKDSWIIEGVQYAWLKKVLRKRIGST